MIVRYPAAKSEAQMTAKYFSFSFYLASIGTIYFLLLGTPSSLQHQASEVGRGERKGVWLSSSATDRVTCGTMQKTSQSQVSCPDDMQGNSGGYGCITEAAHPEAGSLRLNMVSAGLCDEHHGISTHPVEYWLLAA
ncbi:hypothetical protein LY78DRAFT_655735 [Colletotrichum sublineola]|nr:hypothetical protein LY78DRAFT_655735 [Colletotrichum sublineola]